MFGAGSDMKALAISVGSIGVMAAACYTDKKVKVGHELDGVVWRLFWRRLDGELSVLVVRTLHRQYLRDVDFAMWIGFAHKATKDILWVRRSCLTKR